MKRALLGGAASKAPLEQAEAVGALQNLAVCTQIKMAMWADQDTKVEP